MPRGTIERSPNTLQWRISVSDKLILGSLTILIFAVGCRQEIESNSRKPPILRSNADDDVPIDELPEHYRFLRSFGIEEKDYEATKTALPYVEIQLERTECFGMCPSYIVTLRRHGTAEYVGREFAPRNGKHNGEIDLFSFARLCWAIEKFKLANGPREYSARVTDMPTAYLRVKGRDSDLSFQIRDYGGQGPIELWTIHAAIDGVAGRIKWQPIEPAP